MGTGVVAPGDELHLGGIGFSLGHDGRKCLGGIHALDPCGIIFRADHNEVVVGNASSLQPLPIRYELQLPYFVMDNEDVNVAALSVLDGNAGSTGDNIQGYVVLGIELLLDQVKESGIMQTGSSCQLEPFAVRGAA